MNGPNSAAELSLSPVGRVVGLILLAIGGVDYAQRQDDYADQLSRLGFDRVRVVQRQQACAVTNPGLDLKIDLPSGWCLLDTGNDRRIPLTLHHPRSATIVRFRLANQVTELPEDAKGEKVDRYQHVTARWAIVLHVDDDFEMPTYPQRLEGTLMVDDQPRWIAEVVRLRSPNAPIKNTPVAALLNSLEPADVG